MKDDKLPWFLMVVTGVVAIDRLTKIVAIYNLQNRPSIDIFPFLHLTYTTNMGISFGLLKGFPWIPFTVGIVVASLIAWHYRKIPSHWIAQHSAALILAGAIGNVWDRMVYGTVIDFIDLRIWPVFNIADSAITIGGLMAAYYVFIVERKELRKKNKAD
ncbi:MAG: signal peptidase II [Nanoarchaeota archaeon]|mgnify:CR=1 FL=1